MCTVQYFFCFLRQTCNQIKYLLLVNYMYIKTYEFGLYFLAITPFTTKCGQLISIANNLSKISISFFDIIILPAFNSKTFFTCAESRSSFPRSGALRIILFAGRGVCEDVNV